MVIDIDKRLQTMRVLWFALLMSIASFFVFAQFLAPQNSPEPGKATSMVPLLALTAVGIVLVLVSFVVKRGFLRRSVEKQDVALVQQGLVVACAICEVSALLGLVDRFLIGSREFYVLFVIAAMGELLHFPRREHLLAASPKIPIA